MTIKNIPFLILTIVFLFSGCQKDDGRLSEQETVYESPTLVEHVSGDDIPEIIGLIGKGPGNASKSGLVSTPFGEVEMENILQVLDTLGNKNYSFKLFPGDHRPNSIFNLVVSVSDKREGADMAIMEYRMTKGFSRTYYEGVSDFSTFTGTIYKYPFTSSTYSGLLAKDTCVQNFDEIVICDQAVFTNGGVGSGSGIGDGSYTPVGGGSGPGPSGGSGTIVTSGWVCNWRGQSHDHPSDCNNPGAGGEWTITIIRAPDPHTNKGAGTGKGLSCCDDAYVEGSTGVNLITSAISDIIDCIGMLDAGQMAYMGSTLKTIALKNFLVANQCSADSKELARWAINVLSSNPSQLHDYRKSLESMATGLRKFGGGEGKLFAEYIEAIIADMGAMTVGEVKEVHAMCKKVTMDFNQNMFNKIVNVFVTDLAVPVISFALFNVAEALAVKLIQKIPVSWVLRGSRLNAMVREVGLLGKKGFNNTIREVVTNAPITKSRELFNSLTKHAISKTTGANGLIKANMGNGNFITYRPITASSSNIPATISLDFRAAGIWSKVREVKFMAP